MVNLLSPKDLTQLQQAVESRQELRLHRTLGDLSVIARTTSATPPWGCAMLVRLERRRGNLYTTQYFTSIEEMKRYL